MLTYDLEQRGSCSLYEYLYRCIREDISDGTLKPGEKLPSKREMASNYKIAVITVENAYAQLQIEGYITSRERSGYFVSDGMQALSGRNRKRGEDPKRIPKENHKENPKEIPENVRVTGKNRENDPRKIRVDFSSNHTARDSFPFATWAKLMRRVLADREALFLEKPRAEGVRELREAIADYLRKAKGLETEPERIVVGPGTEYLHYLLLQLIGRDRVVAVEDPGYKKVGQLYEGNGLQCQYIPVDGKGLVVEALQGSIASLVHISPSHHFPTGCVMPADRRNRLLQWAQERNAYIVEDDYDSEFRFDGRPSPTLASLDDRHVIYMNTFTKTLAPSIRIAYMALPEELMEAFRIRLPFISGAVSSFEQYTLAAFIREGYYERHISRMRNAYRQHRLKMLHAFEGSRLSEVASVEEDSAGLHFILHVKWKLDDGRFVRELEEDGIRLLPVSLYCYRSAEKYRHRFIVHYSDISEETLRETFQRMGEKADTCRIG